MTENGFQTQTNRNEDSTALYALASLIMGCGFAGISAGESTSDDAYKVVGTSRSFPSSHTLTLI